MANAADAHAHDDHGDHYPGFFSRWFCSTNHKDIGTVYMFVSMFAALVGGGMSWFMRLELAEPGLQYLTGGAPDMQFYNVLLTAHGFLMVFFVVMPALIGGFGNWFVPLMIGAPDMAFPRMNNISLWLVDCWACVIADLGLRGLGCGHRLDCYTHHCHLVFIIQALLLISVSCRCTLLVRRRFWVQSTLS